MKTKYDLIVVGGGFAGVGAAISAAKNGCDVLLIEKNNCLGGAAVNALVMPFMKYWSNDKNTKAKKFLAGNLFVEMMDEFKKHTFKSYESLMMFDDEAIKLVLNRMCIKYGVNLLFDTTVFESNVENGNITSIKALGKSKVIELFADSFIDATGDAEFSYLSGCAAKVGREKDGLCQPMTLCFRMTDIDVEKYDQNKDKIQKII